MARLFTVEVTRCTGKRLPSFEPVTWYEADFNGYHFSRKDEADVTHWIRVMARNVFGPSTQVIFVHKEG